MSLIMEPGAHCCERIDAGALHMPDFDTLNSGKMYIHELEYDVDCKPFVDADTLQIEPDYSVVVRVKMSEGEEGEPFDVYMAVLNDHNGYYAHSVTVMYKGKDVYTTAL